MLISWIGKQKQNQFNEITYPVFIKSFKFGSIFNQSKRQLKSVQKPLQKYLLMILLAYLTIFQVHMVVDL